MKNNDQNDINSPEATAAIRALFTDVRELERLRPDLMEVPRCP